MLYLCNETIHILFTLRKKASLLMKRNILPKLTIFVTIAILFSACNSWLENEFHPLPLSLYPAYEKGDTFFYKSIVTEDLDTFVVSDYVMDTVFNGLILFERTVAIFGQIVSDTFGEEFFYISNEPDAAVFAWDSAYMYFSYGGSPIDTTIQGYDYTNVLSAGAVRLDTISTKLHKIYFDYAYGLIKYEFNNYDSYELFSRPE